MRTIVLEILLLVAVVNFEYTSAVPSYGSSYFTGRSYWNTRCDMNYADDWLGYWNNAGTRKEYRRSPSYTFVSCPCGSCSNNELQCSTLGGTTLYVYTYCSTVCL